MKIALVNQPWFKDYFKESGFTVTFASNQAELNYLREKGERFDLIFFLDNSAPIDPLPFLEDDCLLAYYVVDSHLHLEEQFYLSSVFDIVFVAQKRHVDIFAKINPNSVWLPLFANPVITPELKTDRDLEATFVGHLDKFCHQERKRILEKIANLAPLKIIQAPWWEIYPRSKIVVNKSINHDLNFRVFEALASGCLLITDHIDSGLYDLFKPWQQLLVYETVDECAELIEFGLRHEPLRERIASEGLEIFMKNHTEAHRADQIISQLKKVPINTVGRSRNASLAELGLLKWYYKLSINAGKTHISRQIRERLETLEKFVTEASRENELDHTSSQDG